MHLWQLVLAICNCYTWFCVLHYAVTAEEVIKRVVYRDYHGDMFTITSQDCNQTSCDRRQRQAAAIPGESCKCQCAPTHKTFREDIRECVKDIGDCPLAAFVLPFTVERIPLVTLPPAGQLIYPGAHLTLSGVNLSTKSGHLSCSVKASEILTPKGWHTIEHLTQGRVVFGLVDDANNMFLQWIGNDDDRRLLQHHLVRVRLSCSGRTVQESARAYQPCAALRVGWAPGLATSPTESVPSKQSNYFIIGLCLGILGLMYVLSLLVYLRARQSRRKQNAENQATDGTLSPKSMESGTLGKGSLNPDKRASHDRTSAYHIDSNRRQNTDDEIDPNSADANQDGGDLKKGLQQINPELFEPDMLASPPPLAQEFLQRIREMIAAARGRLRNFRFRPTLLVIPEDDYFYQDLKERDMEQLSEKEKSSGDKRSNDGGVFRKKTGLDKASSSSKEPLESIHGSSVSISSIKTTVSPPQPPPRHLKTKTRKETPVVSRKEVFGMMSNLYGLTKDVARKSPENSLNKSPKSQNSSKTCSRDESPGAVSDSRNNDDTYDFIGGDVDSGFDNVTKFDLFRHDLYKKLQKLQDSQGKSTLNVSTKKERPGLKGMNGDVDGEVDDWNDNSHQNDSVSSESNSNQRKGEKSPESQQNSSAFQRTSQERQCRKADTPKPPLNSQKSGYQNKISRKELLQKIQQDQVSDFEPQQQNSSCVDHSTNNLAAGTSISTVTSDQEAICSPQNDSTSLPETPMTAFDDSSYRGVDSATPSALSRCSTNCDKRPALSNGYNVDSLENSDDESSLGSLRDGAESYVTSSETLPPMSSENELRDSEKCSLTSMLNTPTDSLKSNKSAKAKGIRCDTVDDFQNNLDQFSSVKSQNHLSQNGEKSLLLPHELGANSASIDADQPNSLSDNESAPSLEAYIQLSDQVAKKLSAKKVPGLDYGSSSQEKDKKKFSHLVKNTLGRIGEHFDGSKAKSHSNSNSAHVSDCNWTFRKENTTTLLGNQNATKNDSKTPKKCSPSQNGNAYSSESDAASERRRLKRDKRKEIVPSSRHLNGQVKNSRGVHVHDKKHHHKNKNARVVDNSDSESSICSSIVMQTNSRSTTPGRTSCSDVSNTSCRSTPITKSSKYSASELSSGKSTPSYNRSTVSTSCDSHTFNSSNADSTSIDADSISVTSSDISIAECKGSAHKKSAVDTSESSVCDSMTEDSLNVNGYSSDNDSSDDDNPIDACLTQLANTPIIADGISTHPFGKIDRATKGLDTIQMIKTAGWKHICQSDMKSNRVEQNGVHNGYNSDDTVSSRSSISSTRSGRSKKSRLSDVVSPELQHMSRMLGYFHSGSDFTSDSNGAYSSNTDEESPVVSKSRRHSDHRGSYSDQEVVLKTSKSERMSTNHHFRLQREGRRHKPNSSNMIPSTSEEETACSEDVDCESDGQCCSARSGGESSDANNGNGSSHRSEKSHGRRHHNHRHNHNSHRDTNKSAKKSSHLNGTCKQHVQNRMKNGGAGSHKQSTTSSRSGGSSSSRQNHKSNNHSASKSTHSNSNLGEPGSEKSAKSKQAGPKAKNVNDANDRKKSSPPSSSTPDGDTNKFVTLISVEKS